MKKIAVQYKVKKDRVTENEELVKAVYKQLHDKKLNGFHYLTFKMEDGATFMHIAHAETEKANSEFVNLPAFKTFSLNISERCEEPPVTSQVASIIGSYNFD